MVERGEGKKQSGGQVDDGRTLNSEHGILLASVIGKAFETEMDEGSQPNPLCLFKVKRVCYPEGWARATFAQRKKMLPKVNVEGVWYYKYNETSIGIQYVNPGQLPKHTRDEGDCRAFVAPPIDVDKSRVFFAANRYGQWEGTVPFRSLCEEVEVIHGRPPPVASGNIYWCDQTYDEAFMTYKTSPPEQTPAPAGGGVSSAGLWRAPDPVSHLAPGDGVRRAGDGAAGEASGTEAAAEAAAATAGADAATATEDGEGGEEEEAELEPTVTAPVFPFLTALGAEQPEEVLRAFRGHRAPNPALREPQGPDDYFVLDLCCGAGGAVFHNLSEEQLRELLALQGQAPAAAEPAGAAGAGAKAGAGAGAAAGVGQGCQRGAPHSGASSASRSRGGCSSCEPSRPAPGGPVGTGAGAGAARGTCAAAAGGGPSGAAASRLPRVVHRWAVDMLMSALLSYAANSGDRVVLLCMRLAELHMLLRLVNGLARDLASAPPADGSAEGEAEEEEEQEGEDGAAAEEDDDGEEEWEVADILAVRLEHCVGVRKDGQLARALAQEHCRLGFLVRWRYDPAKDKKRWPDYPKNEHQWVPLAKLSCRGLLRKFVTRVLDVEGLLPKPDTRIILVAGTPCQGITGHNQRREPVMEEQKNLIVREALGIAEFCQVSYVVLEQVTEATQLEDGKYRRMVQGTISEMRGSVTDVGDRYQQRLALIHAASHGAPQSRPRVFFLAAAAHLVLPPVPRPQFSFCVLLDRETGRMQGPRPRVRALDRCQPMAGEGSQMFPSQVVADAISNQEEVSNYSSSPVTFPRDPDYPLQHYLSRPPPEGTPSADVRFATYLGNCAPAVLAFPRAVLFLFHRCRAEEARKQRKRAAERARRARIREARAKAKAAQALEGATGAAAEGAAGAAGDEAAKGPAAGAQQPAHERGAAGVTAMTAKVAGPEVVADRATEAALVRVGAEIAALDSKSIPPLEAEPGAQAGPQAGRKRSLREAHDTRRLSHLAAGVELVKCAREALRRAMEQAPRCLEALQRELERLEGPQPAAARPPAPDPACDGAPAAAAAATGAAAAVKPGGQLPCRGREATAPGASQRAPGSGRGVAASREQAASGAGDEIGAGSGRPGPSGSGSGSDEPCGGGGGGGDGGGGGGAAAAVACGAEAPLRLQANHAPFPLSLSKYERCQGVPLQGGRCYWDIPGAEDEASVLPCGAPLLTEPLRKKLCGERAKAAAPDRNRAAARPYGRVYDMQRSNTVCGGSRFTEPEKGSFLAPRQHRLLTPREAACIQGYALHHVFLTAQSPFLKHLRDHAGLVSRAEAVLKPAIRGLRWLLDVAPAALGGTDRPGKGAEDKAAGLDPSKLKYAWEMLRRTVRDEQQQVGNSWAPPVAEAIGRCLALALCGLDVPGGQAHVADPAWAHTWRWAARVGVRCAQELVQGRHGPWVAGPEEAEERAADGDVEGSGGQPGGLEAEEEEEAGTGEKATDDEEEEEAEEEQRESEEEEGTNGETADAEDGSEADGGACVSDGSEGDGGVSDCD